MKKLLTILATFSILIYSCGQREKYKGTSADIVQKEADQQSTEKAETKVERKIIKEGEISFETASINETESLITKTVESLNGYISKDNAVNYPDKIEHRIVIRVPSDKFDLLLKKLSESVDKFDSKNIDVLDVTEEYIDIDTRIKTKKELENRYKELLKQTNKVDEILNIEKEIGQLRTEIESVEGRMKYLQDRISYSTLTATYYQKTTSAFRFATKFGQAIKSGWDGFLWFLIGLTHLWTFIIIGVVVLYFVIRQQRKKKKNAT